MHQPGQTLTERLGRARLASRDIDELIGVCKGVLADGVVNLHEAMFILEWLEAHRSAIDIWPASVLYEATDRMLEDGKLSQEQESELLGILVEITGVPVRVGVTERRAIGYVAERTLNTSTTLPLHEPDDGLIFDGMNFVLTGKFGHGTRSECENIVRRLGGIAQKTVTKATHYLVVGEIGTESWAHSSFGRKIEKAVQLRDLGHRIYIVHEQTWLRFVEQRR